MSDETTTIHPAPITSPNSPPPTLSPDLPHLDRLPPLRQAWLKVARLPGEALFRSWWDIRIHGEEHIPADGPVILAANHLGVIDGPLLVSVMRRRTYALAKIELFDGYVGSLLHLVGQIPVARGVVDTHALSRSIQVLRAGRCLTIFPEGLRGRGDMSSIRGGAAYLAMVTGAPVVPVALLGTRVTGTAVTALPPRGTSMHIVYGGPVRIQARPWPRRQTDVRDETARLQQRLADHVRDAERLTGVSLPGPAR